jgi:transglutaminase-like putative cysteine protease
VPPAVQLERVTRLQQADPLELFVERLVGPRLTRGRPRPAARRPGPGESVMEVRLAPRDDGRQKVRSVELPTDPSATVFRYIDALGNDVHHFDIVVPHEELLVEARMRVRTTPAPAVPERLDASAWGVLDRLRAGGHLWGFFEPSPRVPVSPAVRAFAEACGVERAADPLTCFRRIVSAVYGALAYVPESTTVDTAVEAVLDARRGVCQDFSHVALAIARAYGIPCRYVSGYLAPAPDRMGEQRLTTHAWVEAWLPGLEWTALDPTHDIVAGERHIAAAVGRDYGDASPTRGVFRGGSGALSVSVRIEQDGEACFSTFSRIASGAPVCRTSDNGFRQ